MGDFTGRWVQYGRELSIKLLTTGTQKSEASPRLELGGLIGPPKKTPSQQRRIFGDRAALCSNSSSNPQLLRDLGPAGSEPQWPFPVPRLVGAVPGSGPQGDFCLHGPSL